MAERRDIEQRASGEDGIDAPANRPIVGYALWIAQVLLALLFLLAGAVKLVLPPEAMTGPVPLPVLFLRFIGVCEVLGGLGLVLPGMLRIRPGLTPLAAAGLVIIMIGATVITVIGGGVVSALMPLAAGVLSAFVAYGRCQLMPHKYKTISEDLS
jgi:uncharacterized membrane protein YphA (DoxX/SURF4 family)